MNRMPSSDPRPNYIDQSLPVIREDKCCVECEHFRVETGTGGWSEYTPDETFHMWCNKDIWAWESYGPEDEWRKAILSAQRCVLFTPRGGLP